MATSFDCCRCSSSLSEDFHRVRFWENLAQLRADNSFCDISININGAIFAAHKVVLSAATQYFNAMFLSGLIENNSKEVTLSGIEGDTFEVLLDYMYTGELKLNNSNAADVLIASDMLNLNYAVKKCLDFLIHNITADNCITLWNLADRYNCFNNLIFAVETFVRHNFLDIVKLPSFYEIQYSFFVSLLCSEDVRIEGEHQLLSVIVAWVLHDKDSRCERLSELLSQVRLPMISEHALTTEIDKIDDVDVKKQVVDITERNKACSESLSPLKTMTRNELCESFLRYCDFDAWLQRQHIPRKSSRKHILVIGGFSASSNPGDFMSMFRVVDNLESFGCVEMYDTYGADWEVVGSLNQPRSNHCAVRYRNLVYVLGGESENLISDSVEVYNSVQNKWSFLPQSMTTPRTSFGAAVIDDTIFAFGGWVGSELGTSIECFEPKLPTSQWRVIDELPFKRYAFGAVAHEGFIYVVGGTDENSRDLATCEAYHPASRTWITLPSMIEKRSQVVVVVCNSFLYAIGGSNFEAGTLSSVERLCFQTNEWRLCAPMKVARASPAAAVWDDKIFVFCGKLVSSHSTNNITSDTSEVYCPQNDEWCMLVRAPTSRGEACAVVI